MLRALLLGIALATAAHADVAVPALTTRVTDLTNTLSATERAALEQKLEAFEKRKGSQIAVLIVPTTEPEEIEQYSIRVVDQWKLGRKGIDDGALLVVAKNDRRLRIEVGRGLEGVVPDIAAKQIVADTITPKFRAGDFFGGIDAGVSQLIRLIDGEPLPPPREDWSRRQPGGRGGDIGSVFPFLLFGAIALGGFLRRVVGRFPGAMATGGLIGFVTWILVGVLAVGVAAGFVAFLVTLVGLASGPGWSSGRRGGYRGPIGGWGGGGFGGGGFGGGFGGGGGGFSGGGASGRW